MAVEMDTGHGALWLRYALGWMCEGGCRGEGRCGQARLGQSEPHWGCRKEDTEPQHPVQGAIPGAPGLPTAQAAGAYPGPAADAVVICVPTPLPTVLPQSLQVLGLVVPVHSLCPGL